MKPGDRTHLVDAKDTPNFEQSTLDMGEPDAHSSSSKHPPSPAQIDDYEILEEIARGGMGVVYKARQLKLGRIVALKTIKSGSDADEGSIRRFLSEAEAAASLDHPNIIPIYEVGQWQDSSESPTGEKTPVHFFSMGYVEGNTLADELKAGPLSATNAAKLVRQICDGMQYAHEKGIVHRDLKPANILLAVTPDSESSESTGSTSASSRGMQSSVLGLTPRIADFGLAKNIADDNGLTASGNILGTPSFMPPEQATGSCEEIGPRSDVYSIGAILYATITGRPPFQAANVLETLKQVSASDPVAPRSLVPTLDKDLETICLKCLAKETNKRYASAQALAADLQRFLERKPILARRSGSIERGLKWCRRNQSLAVVGGVALLLLIALAIGGPVAAWQQSRFNRELTLANTNLDLALENARTEERRADDNLDRADEVVHRFVTEIADDSGPLTLYPGTQQLRSELLEMGRDYYELLIEQNDEARLTPRLADANYELAKILSKVSVDSKRATEVFEEAIRLYRLLLNERPDDLELQRNLSASLERIGSLYMTVNRIDSAQSALDEAIEITRQLVKTNPDSLNDQHRLASTLNNLGWLLADHFDRELGLAEQIESVKIREHILQEQPESGLYRQGLSQALGILGDHYLQLNRVDEAGEALQRAHLIMNELYEERPKHAEYEFLTGVSHFSLATYWKRTGAVSENIAHLREARGRLQHVVDQNPSVVIYRQKLLDVMLELSESLILVNQIDEAKDLANDANAIAHELADENPSSPEYLWQLASAAMNRATQLYDARDYTESVNEYLVAATHLEQIVRDNPLLDFYRRRLAVVYNNLGLAYAAKGDSESAYEIQTRAVGAREALLTSGPQPFQFRIEFAGSLVNLANLESENDPVLAVQRLDRAEEILCECLDEKPSSPIGRQFYASALAVRGIAFGKLERHKDAVHDFRLALEYALGKSYVDINHRLCRAMARDGDYVEATELADEVYETTRSARDAYILAGCYAQAARAASEDAELSQETRDEFVEQFSSQAVSILNDLEGSDHFNTEERRNLLRTDPDLKVLFQREDYRQVLEHVEERYRLPS